MINVYIVSGFLGAGKTTFIQKLLNEKKFGKVMLLENEFGEVGVDGAFFDSALKIKEMFGCIMTGCDVKKGKPSPDIYLETAKNLGVSPSECLVFEDVIMGIKAGKNAGMQVCAIEDDFSLYQTEEKIKLADYYIKDYYEIISCRG